MKNMFSFIAGLFGTTGVALGALGAHALKQKMHEGMLTIDQLNAFDTATKYQLIIYNFQKATLSFYKL